MRLVFFLIAAFCRLAKSLSHSELMGWLVGRGGGDRTHDLGSFSKVNKQSVLRIEVDWRSY